MTQSPVHGLRRYRSTCSLRRLDSRCVVEVDGAHSVTVQDRLEEIGTGRYQYSVLAGVGGALMSECLEMGAVAPLNTALSREFALSSDQRTCLPLLTYLGASIGLFVAGPLSDGCGRRFALVTSLVSIAAIMFVTALLPARTPAGVVMVLRFCAGLAGAIQVPAGQALAAESCSPSSRAHLFFQIALLGAFGYLLESVGVQLFMPHFGEDPADAWRMFCVVTGFVAGVMVPIVFLLNESPSFYAVSGDAESCVAVLDNIARTNGKPAMNPDVHVEQGQPTGGEQKEDDSSSRLGAYIRSHWPLLTLLAAVDSSRAFFVSGSSYLWKDLFMLASGSEIEPATLNVIASMAPMVGILATEPLLFLGVRMVSFICAAISALAFAALTQSHVCLVAMPLVTCVITIKLTMAPMSTCVGLIKAEAFPTEIRVSAYSIISFFAKVATILAPTLTEELKGGTTADYWSREKLRGYISCLMVATILTGLLLLLVPGESCDGGMLEDFMTDGRTLKVSTLSRYGSVANVWELGTEDTENAQGRRGAYTWPKMPLSKSMPDFTIVDASDLDE